MVEGESLESSWVNDRVCSQGFYVLVDFHAAPGDTTVQSGNLVRDWQDAVAPHQQPPCL